MRVKPSAFLIMAVGLALSLGSCSSEPDNTEAIARGQRLHEETAGGVGCASCHGMTARGEGLAPDIRGVTSAEILDGIRNTEDMRDIALTMDDINNLAAYFASSRKRH